MTLRKPKLVRVGSTERKTVRAAVYARYSTINNSPYSCDEQVQRMRHRVETNQIHSKMFPNAKIVIDESWVVKDEAQSGRTTARDGYELIKQGAIGGKKVDLILVDDIARLTRDIGETLDLFDALVFSGVEGISVSDNISTVDDNARELFLFKGFANEQQWRSVSKNTIRGLEVRALAGFSTGHCPYGFSSAPTRTVVMKGVERGSHFEIRIDPEEATVVIRIWRLFADGHGQNAIATMLNNDGVASPGRRRWTTKTVWNILTNEKYTGRWAVRMTKSVKNPDTDKFVQVPRPEQEWLVSEREDLRIIPKDLEGSVRSRRDQIEKGRSVATTPEGRIFSNVGGQPRHLLIGTMVCGCCGSNMIQVSGSHGGYIGCYAAYRQATSTCTNKKKERMRLVEDRVLAVLGERLDRPETYQNIASRYNELIGKREGDLPVRTEKVEREISEIEKKVANYQRFIGAGHWSETIAADLVSSEAQLKALRAEKTQLQRVSDQRVYITPMAVRERMRSLGDVLELKVAEANKILRRVFPEKIVMTPVGEGKRAVYRAKAAVNVYGLQKCDSVVGGVPQVPGVALGYIYIEFDIPRA